QVDLARRWPGIRLHPGRSLSSVAQLALKRDPTPARRYCSLKIEEAVLLRKPSPVCIHRWFRDKKAQPFHQWPVPAEEEIQVSPIVDRNIRYYQQLIPYSYSDFVAAK